VAAAVITAAGPAAAFAVDAATYVVAAAATLPLRLRPVPVREGRSPRGATGGVLAGLRVAWTAPGARVLFGLGFTLWLTFGAFLVLEPVFVRDVLGRSVTTFALLQTVFGIGLVGAGLALPRLRRSLDTPSRMSLVIAAAGVAATAYAATPLLPVAFAASFAWGVSVALFSAPSRTLLLQRTPESAHGRVLGAWQAVNSLGQLLPALAVPVLAGLGTQAVLVGVGVLLAGVGATTWAAGRPAVPGCARRGLVARRGPVPVAGRLREERLTTVGRRPAARAGGVLGGAPR
jgi:MFS family permease